MKTTRRKFLAALAAIPFVGNLLMRAKADPKPIGSVGVTIGNGPMIPIGYLFYMRDGKVAEVTRQLGGGFYYAKTRDIEITTS